METYTRVEDMPAVWPAPADGLLSEAAAALDVGLIWGRLEEFIAWRWSARDVEWVVTGPGDFKPDLAPATLTASEIWDAGWSPVSLDASFLGGFELPGYGPYRFTATVGGGDVPALVWEAFRRLAEYMAEQPERQGAGRFSETIGPMSSDFDRSAKWVAMAMQLSGAADLLRSYRRV